MSEKRIVGVMLKVTLAVALILMIGHLLVYVTYTARLVQFPFDYDQGEGFELNDTVLLSQGQWPYRDNAVYPFYASNYPPLFHVLLVPFVWLFGAQYWYGRLAGFIATLITAAAIGYAVQRETRQRAIALLAGLAYLASNYIYHIGPLFRQHITMVMFETLAIVALSGVRFLPSPIPTKKGNANRALWFGLICLLAAGYTKQLAITTVGAFFAYLFIRSPRRAIVYGIGFGVVAGAIFLAINVSTGGQWWTNIITANVNQYIIGQAIGLARQFFGLHGALFVLACLYALYELYLARLSAYVIWFGFAMISAALSGKWGAGDSYFATLIAAMCILAGLFAGNVLSGRWSFADNYLSRFGRRVLLRLQPQFKMWAGSLLKVGTAAAFILYGLAVIHLPLSGPIFGTIAQALHLQSNTKFADFYDAAGWTQGYATIGQLPSDADSANGWQIVAAIGSPADGRPALSEEAAFSFRAGKPIVTNPTQLLNLYLNGHYDPATLIAMIQAQRFSVVIFRARFYPQPVLEAIDANYQLVATIPMNGYSYQVLKPRQSLDNVAH